MKLTPERMGQQRGIYPRLNLCAYCAWYGYRTITRRTQVGAGYVIELRMGSPAAALPGVRSSFLVLVDGQIEAGSVMTNFLRQDNCEYD